ncbi:hypothetical protein I302_107928 [Kwoniella bestiolae CBS 10118]|uniref:Phytanoyl-CoA dioxygenase n=1 Tax=Kwoniella bestiolae CBS 10118 TaxID=1296100 RepID=A0A1B9FX65_9TREE|nr:hypothetical protein I302_07708 [Kwoniella bestiolae CBS 10118]OCF23354.1 hypothetical protein I302_07708 [Kwoniella bestiolae CBS 10118]
MATTQTELETEPRLTLKLRSDNEPKPEWLETLEQEGWVVVKGVLSSEKAKTYEDAAYAFLESFGMGFDRNDKTTWVPEQMPFFFKGGLFHRYGTGHEQFLWDIKQEPAVVDKFAKVWGTEKLVSSFDGCNISLPIAGRDPNDFAFKPWPHVDQSPLVTGLHCVQGIMNLCPNGPEDGGLMLLKGSKALYAQLWEAFDDVKPPGGWNKGDRHDHTPEQMQWLIDNGCEYHKVCAEPGDLILWDSRVVHYGATPASDNPRIASYVCYKPACLVTEDIAQKRRKAWEEKVQTSHDPITFRTNPRQAPEDHPTYDHPKVKDLQAPVLTDLGKKLAGLESW